MVISYRERYNVSGLDNEFTITHLGCLMVICIELNRIIYILYLYFILLLHYRIELAFKRSFLERPFLA